MSSPMPSGLPPRLQVEELLMESPFERVFRAHDSLLQRDVMVKLPATQALATWSAPVRERLLREARALAKIRHPGIAAIHTVEETLEGPALVMDLPEGELLAERLQRGPLEIAEVVAIGIRLGEALAHVHLQGIVHRGVGPSAIRLFADGRVQLGLFTFAKEFGSRGHVSSLMHGHRMDEQAARHLPDYSAPEQLAGQPADPRADVFALGCTLFRCLTGQDAFPPGREHEPMPELRKLRREVPAALAEVVRKCTLHGKTARFPTAHAVVEALRATESAAGVGGVSRRSAVLLLLAAACVGVGAFFVTRRVGVDSDLRGFDAAREGDFENRYAKSYAGDYAHVLGLFVGIGTAYGDRAFSALRNPVGEVEAVTKQLAENDPKWAAPGAIRKLLDHDATKEGIVAAMHDIQEKATADDGVLFYFAGHGSNDGAIFGIAAADAASANPDDAGFLRRERLLNFVTRCRAKHVLVILDCCHAGAVFDFGASRGAVAGRPPGRVEPADWRMQHFSREFLCSAGKDEAARDGVVRSPFCEALLQQLTKTVGPGESPYLPARYLGSDIARALEPSNHRAGPLQMPEIRPMLQQEGSFLFRLKAAAK